MQGRGSRNTSLKVSYSGEEEKFRRGGRRCGTKDNELISVTAVRTNLTHRRTACSSLIGNAALGGTYKLLGDDKSKSRRTGDAP